MSRQAIIAIAVAAIIILGAGAAFLYSQTKNTSKQAVTTSAISPTKEVENNAMTNTLTSLLSSGKNTMCTFKTGNEKGETSGTFYISEDKARGDFTVTANGKEESTHMIKTGDTFYMWGDSLKAGIKMVMNINEMADKMKTSGDLAGIDPSKELGYKCAAWTVDNSLFTAPATIKFMSIGNMMPTTTSKTSVTPAKKVTQDPKDNSSQCNICNSLTGEAKNTCLTQLNCQ